MEVKIVYVVLIKSFVMQHIFAFRKVQIKENVYQIVSIRDQIVSVEEIMQNAQSNNNVSRKMQQQVIVKLLQIAMMGVVIVYVVAIRSFVMELIFVFLKINQMAFVNQIVRMDRIIAFVEQIAFIAMN